MWFFTRFLVIAALSASCFAEVINIPDDFETIQAGINASEDGDTVLVQPGTYFENINFSGRNILVASQFIIDGDVANIDSTIIDGDSNGGSVVVFRNGEGNAAALIGFTIQNGRTDYGGGIYCSDSNPSLISLKVIDNVASQNGGGIYCTQNAATIIANAFISGNSASQGGGVTCYNEADVTISNSVITGNSGRDDAGGIHCSNSNLMLHRVEITDNEARDAGAGITCTYSSRLIFDDGVIVGNSSNLGSAIFINAGQRENLIELSRVLVSGNGHGDNEAISIEQGSSVFRNLTIIDNNCPNAIQLDGGTVSIVNTILRGHENREINGYAQDDTISFCNVEGGIRGEGNIDEDPLFVDPDDGDYHLSENSPCIDAGDPDSPEDPDGTRVDIGAFYFHQIQQNQNPPGEFDLLEPEDGSEIMTNNSGFELNFIWESSVDPDSSAEISYMARIVRDIWSINEELHWYLADSIITWHSIEDTFLLVDFAEDFWEHARAGLELNIHWNVAATSQGDTVECNHGFSFTLAAIDGVDPEIRPSSGFMLESVYPNPFNSLTTISYTLSTQSQISLRIYNIRGQLVDVLVDGVMATGTHSVVWDGEDKPAGVYLVRMHHDHGKSIENIHKVLLVK